MFKHITAFLIICATATTTSPAAADPTMTIAADGFPSGHDTPEGAAADLGRALIAKNAKAFEDACVRPYGGGQSRQEYQQFLKEVASTIRAENERATQSPIGPKLIGKVFAARHLSANGPASYAYAAFGFQDLVFVDVGVHLQDGTRALNRTLVIRDRDGKWYAHPAPQVSPLLSQGLHSESPSTQDYSEASAGSGS